MLIEADLAIESRIGLPALFGAAFKFANGHVKLPGSSWERSVYRDPF
jgi:hypothetical protein